FANGRRLVDQCVLTMRNAMAKCQDDNWDCKCSAQANIAKRSRYLGHPGPAAATPAQISDVNDDEFDNKKSASSSEPTKSLKAENSAKTSEGAAAGNAAGSWLALVGLGIGMAF
ncbi:hypothetical protein N7509_006113, partial [Penicillium cosmopolitanum]